MAPATPSRSLPKSNFHQSIASAPATREPASAVPLLDEPALQPQKDLASHSRGHVFNHSDHVIPPRSYHGVENLVIVCCHAIYHPDASSPSFPLYSPLDERNWHLAPFQKSDPESRKPSEHETYLAHINAGLDTLDTGSWAGKSLLILSGGVTKRSLTPLSEARSYYNAALAQAMSHGHRHGGRPRRLFDKGQILLEECATDSYQNLLFSILLFRRTTGIYPKEIRVITHAFKAKRFLEIHAPDIQWPADRIRVQGIDPIMSIAEYESTNAGEKRFGQAPWLEDPHGIGELLGQKRKQRGHEEEPAQELGAGLEASVSLLLIGNSVAKLPWSITASL
ncbi:hypothetical protein BCR34DRAFT_498384 [Clohesyomyces aquaticus]|uniref:DUF218 domain-containing protein n=1 Tax=Clohesyomyces aquaticus TaxID=1231657 RepID=A0A1Y1YD40_9PLEO|nr:hypothetical protein BCR34DRAFT_498384 [Clohesyomyces aquaticus]